MKMIRFRCPSGHKVRANAIIQGKKVSCPRCHEIFFVPTSSQADSGDTNDPDPNYADTNNSAVEAARAKANSSGLLRTTALRHDDSNDVSSIVAHDTVTESGAFQFLDQIDKRQAKLDLRPPRKNCPRCGQLVDHSARICCHCHVYLGVSDRQWHLTLDKAAQEVVENPLRKRD